MVTKTKPFRFLIRGAFTCWALLVAIGFFTNSNAQENQTQLVGVAKVDITPTRPVVLAGYGSRTKPYESIETKLWVRALVIGRDSPVAMVVLDNCGTTREVTSKIRSLLAPLGFEEERVNVAATHTHNAPNLTGYAPILWQGRMTDEQIKETEAYTQVVIQKAVQAVREAKENAFEASLAWTQGRVTFGGNRRVINGGRWSGFGFQMDAPVDHSLPVMIAKDSKKSVRAIWANYACHCTTLGSKNVVAGDWAGYANQLIESKFPQATSLISIGCGADVGPQPTGSSTLAKSHGLKIADEIKRLIEDKRWVELNEPPTVAVRTLQLPLEQPKAKSHWEKLAQSRSFEKELARNMLRDLESQGKINEQVEYPISVWRFGKSLSVVFMPGEVVVDYSVRLKSELDWQRLWITGWTNRMPGYIPSKKVLAQGGYEAEFSQTYYGLPGRYQVGIEDQIVSNIKKLVGREFDNPKDRDASPFHQIPSREQATFEAFQNSVASLSPAQKKLLRRVNDLIPQAQPGLAKLTHRARTDHWFNLYGDKTERVFIRQDGENEQLQWNTAQADSEKTQSVFCFTGGLGWESQSKSNGFVLATSNGDSVNLDVVREPTAWTSNKETFKLIYIPTWKSNEDSAGFFFLVFDSALETGTEVSCTIRSRSKDSQRWFGLDVKQNLGRDLKKLKGLLEAVEIQN